MDMYEIVMKLVGEVNPVGELHVDSERFDNLVVLTELTDRLLTDIDRIATDNKNRVEYSMNKAGKHCDEFLDKIGIVE